VNFQERENELRQRRNKYAQQLDSLSGPQGQNVGGVYVAPNALEYVAAGLRGIGALRGQDIANQELKAIGQEKTQANQKALAEFLRLSQGAPENAPADGVGPVMPGQQPNMQGAYTALMNAPDEALRSAGAKGAIEIPQIQAKQADREQEREFKRAQLQEQFNQRLEMMREQNASRQEMAAAQRDFQKEMAQQNIAARREMSAMAKGGQQSQPYYQPVQTSTGVMAFNARTGGMEPVLGVDGNPVVGAQFDPALQGSIAGAKTSANEKVKSVQEAKGDLRKTDIFLQQLKQAEDILKSGPTQSGLGAVADAAGRVVGVSTQGAQKAGQLEAISGWLVSNVPRMEGPQSNFDVQNYITMAGKIGDRTVPVAERAAALKEVRRLQEKYKASAEQRIAGQGSKSATKSGKFEIINVEGD